VASRPWLGAAGGGVGVSRLEGSGGGKVDSLGCRGYGGRRCWAAIVAHIHDFLTVGGGIGQLFVGRWVGLGLRRRDWSSPAFSGEGIPQSHTPRLPLYRGSSLNPNPV